MSGISFTCFLEVLECRESIGFPDFTFDSVSLSTRRDTGVSAKSQPILVDQFTVIWQVCLTGTLEIRITMHRRRAQGGRLWTLNTVAEQDRVKRCSVRVRLTDGLGHNRVLGSFSITVGSHEKASIEDIDRWRDNILLGACRNRRSSSFGAIQLCGRL